jgi:cytochrome o ubiquinol oxidase operon protein cyoD
MNDAGDYQSPGDEPKLVEEHRSATFDAVIYTTGLALAILLTVTSFWAATTNLLWAPGIPLGLAALAIAQMGVHLVFFLHLTTDADNTNIVLAIAFGLLVVFLIIAGSLWIMTDLNANMTHLPETTDLQVQH